MHFFLRAKAWQLCLLMVVPYAVFKLTAFGQSAVTYGFLWLYFLLVILGWFFTIARESLRQTADGLRSSDRLFRVAIALPVIHIVLITFLVWLPWSRGELDQQPSWLLPMHFVAIFSYFYCLWFTAKTYTTAREQHSTQFIDYYLPFMGFWLCVVGVWFLQPDINRRLGQVNDSSH
ncbi:MAG: hypothetical protein AAF402_14640 [Pseudomonadota bacterium]